MALSNFIGFGLGGYRSFNSSDLQFIGPFGNIHLVVGRNNVGKSNVLHFAYDVVRMMRNIHIMHPNEIWQDPLDWPQGGQVDDPFRVAIGLRLTDKLKQSVPGAQWRHLAPLFETEAFNRGMPGDVWFEFVAMSRSGNFQPSGQQMQAALQQANSGSISTLLYETAAAHGGTRGSDEGNFEQLLMQWKPLELIPDMTWVDTIREINNIEGAGTGTRNGRGLIADLADLQQPNFANFDRDTRLWQNLNRFVAAVLDDQSAQIRVPTDKSDILVSTDSGGTFPLKALGTGISEVIVLAAASTTVTDTLICMEEPELHLHPTLQRMLINYLSQDTANHYLISTHSASLLNADLATITHVTQQEGWSQANLVVDPRSLSDAVVDLGNRPSDLVQSNFVVWVEGPSDRLYVREWIRQIDSTLIEGAHYSIVFYGGGLLNHLSADDAEARDFIQLLRVNRHLALVMDSDRKTAGAQLNETKRRVIEELGVLHAPCWVTSGYTIENYVPQPLMRQALQDEYPNKTYALPGGQFKSPLGKTFTGVQTKPSKVSVARRLIDNGLDIDECLADVRPKIQELVEAIRSANGLSPGGA